LCDAVLEVAAEAAKRRVGAKGKDYADDEETDNDDVEDGRRDGEVAKAGSDLSSYVGVAVGHQGHFGFGWHFSGFGTVAVTAGVVAVRAAAVVVAVVVGVVTVWPGGLVGGPGEPGAPAAPG
jgi:hypothetical protein